VSVPVEEEKFFVLVLYSGLNEWMNVHKQLQMAFGEKGFWGEG